MGQRGVLLRHSPTFAAFLTALCLAAVPLLAQPRPLSQGVAPFVSVNAATVALTNARLVDGTGTPARANHTVVIGGDRILAIGPSTSISLPDDALVLDLSGYTLLPGLVGLHEHTYFGGVRHLTQMSVSAPLLYLAYGVTTAMTAGSQLPYHELNMLREVDAGRAPGPRFRIAGPYLNGAASRNPMSRNVDTADEMRRVIAYWASEGATWLKFMGSLTRELLRAGVDEAHARGLKTTGHLCSVTFTEAAALGLDALQHGFITNSEYVPGKQPDVCPPTNMQAQADVDVKSDAVQASIRAIVAAGTAVVSTLAVYETFVPARRLDPRALEMLDPIARREVEDTHEGLAGAAFHVPERLLRRMMEWERDFVTAGGLLGAGADPWGTGLLPGLGDLRNYELLVESGFTPEQALQIVTLNGARILGEDSQVGSLAVGKVADIVVVRGDPVATPGDVYDIVTVFKDGLGFDAVKLREAARGRVGVN